MRKKRIFAVLLMLSLGFAPLGAREAAAASTERPISGLVTQIQPHSGTLVVGSERFTVPGAVYDLRELSVGTHVVVSFRRSYGRSVATAIEVDEEGQ